MSKRGEKDGEKRLEALLKRGLDQIADLGDEAPPTLATLQMLVADVRGEQKRRLYADLVRFWGVAALVLAGLAWVLLREPVFFLALQAALGILSLVGAGLWVANRRRVVE